ncbi:MAG: GNAT family N-acetyltransferase [Alphaproteobacteria bacterium]|nr:GNAT family N-acetyltransferase [Alphaproteobacteria bacterium]
MNRTIVVRRAAVSDAPHMAALIHAAFGEFRGRLQPESGALSESADAIAAQLAAPAGGAVALRPGDAGDAVGCVLFRPQDDDLYLGRLSVPPALRGRGIAGALIRFVEDEARRRGCAGVVLGVRIVLRDNKRLFEHHGFVEIARTAHDGFDAPTSITLRKSLQLTFA